MNTNWLRARREQMNLNQGELAARLQIAGFNITRASVSHWEVGRSAPPIEDPDFRKALAQALKVSVPTLLRLAGYEVAGEFSDQARHAAEIIDQLPDEKRKLALEVLETFLRHD